MTQPAAVFVVGNSRSGTTMLARILGRSPEIHTLTELHFLDEILAWPPPRELSLAKARDAYARLLVVEREHYFKRRNWRTYRHEAEVAVAEMRDRTPAHILMTFMKREALGNGATLSCDQTPTNVYFIRTLLEWIPSAHIVGIVRDPRDVLLSQRLRWRTRNFSRREIPLREAFRYWSTYNAIGTSKTWNAGVRALEAVTASPQVSVVRFEDVVADTREALSPILRQLGVEWCDDMLSVPRMGSSRHVDSPELSGIDQSGVGGWKRGLHGREVRICWSITGSLAERYGYECDDDCTPPSAADIGASLAAGIAKAPLVATLAPKRALRHFRRAFGGGRST